MTDPLWCPRCRTPLTPETAELWRCDGCGGEIPIRDGVVQVRPPGPYWGEIPVSDAEDLVEACEAGGVEAATREWLRDRPALGWFGDYVLDAGRADWRHLLKIEGTGKVLDLGAGWGTISAAFAGDGHRVYAVEPVESRVRMIALRARELAGNLVPVRSDVWTLPFPEKHFDLILLVGVLEWIPTATGPIDDPTAVQLRALRHCREFLKPGGSLLLAIENRMSVRYFLGKTDHGDPTFTPLMPRWLADLVCVASRRTRYQTRTYGARGYRRLLGKAGLEVQDVLLTLDYQFAGMISDWDGGPALREYFRRLFEGGRRTRLAVALDRVVPVHRLWPYFSPSYLVHAIRKDG